MLLLDEPLGALDLKLREEMQIELKSLQRRLGITFVYVTHDQGEALSMADRVAVFNQGRIEQLAAPRELYTRPAHGVRRALRRQRQRRRTRELAQRLSGSARSRSRSAPRTSTCCAERAAAPRRTRAAAPAPWSPCSIHGAASRWQVQLDAGEVWSALVTGRGRARARTASAVGARVQARLAARRGRAAAAARRHDACARASTFFYRRPYWYLALLLVPPLLWFGTVYLGSLFALLAQSFYRIDDFTAQIVREPTLATYKQLVTQPANVDIVLRTLIDGASR